jgi:hypothetical protein
MRKHPRRPSPAMGVALIALFIALGGTTYAATGDNFILGQPNSASNQTSLTAPVSAATAGGNKVLQLTNTSTATGAQGLGISVGANKTPIFVNANAGKATNLNADKLDGLDSTALQRRVNGTCTGAQAVNGIDVGGSVGCGATRPEPRITNTPVLIPSSTTFTTDGGPVLIQLSCTAFRADADGPGPIGVVASIDGIPRFGTTVFASETSSHKTTPPNVFWTTLDAGQHTLGVAADVDTQVNVNDFCYPVVLDFPG